VTAEFEAAIGRVCCYTSVMPNDPEVRWHQRLQSFHKALVRLSEGARLAPPLERYGLIQAFEYQPR